MALKPASTIVPGTSKKVFNVCIKEIVGIAVLSKHLSPGTYAVPVARGLALLGPL